MQKKLPVTLGKRGFTLIEVVLVLAIGSLIFILAFLAFRQVNINRRDTQRRADVNKMIAALQTNYLDTKQYPASSNINISAVDICIDQTYAVANSFIKFLQDYMCEGSEFISPSGVNYNLFTWGNMTYVKDRIRYRRNARCDGTSAPATAFFIMMDLEKGRLCRESG